LHNKPIGCSASEAYALGPDEEEEEEEESTNKNHQTQLYIGNHR